MKWTLVNKKRTPRPTKGNYSEWKETLAKEGAHQCVYCCIAEAYFGGIRNFHVEHRKPKSLFEALTNDYDNLFYACGICNVFKSDDWPVDDAPALDCAFYPDPQLIDYSSIFTVDPATGLVSGKNGTGAYIVERLHLNRPQLITARRLHYVMHELSEINVQLAARLPGASAEFSKKAAVCLSGIVHILQDILGTRPYARADER